MSEFVAKRRAMGASWATVARMLGCSEDAARRAYDFTAGPKIAVLPACDPDARPQWVLPGTLQAQGLRLLADRDAMTVVELRQAAGMEASQAYNVVCSLKRRRLIARVGHHWSVTELGLEEAARLAQVDRARAAELQPEPQQGVAA
jgi:hypothetical protein